MGSNDSENAARACPGASRIRSSLGKGAQVGLLLLLAVFLISGCTKDQERREAIKKAVKMGRFEQAERMARDGFADDKLEMLLLLEYIEGQKEKAERAAYLPALSTRSWGWTRGPGGNVVVRGEVLNGGPRPLAGFALEAECLKGGRVVARGTLRKIGDVGPGKTAGFELSISGAADCDQVEIAVLDVGFQQE